VAKKPGGNIPLCRRFSYARTRGLSFQFVVKLQQPIVTTPNPFRPDAEYFVPNWPATPAGKRWREVPQGRDVPQEKIGREPIFSWEAKVYALV
jgi:hypothetical protein